MNIYEPNPVLVCVANFCNKYPNAQWPDTTIKVYFLLITEPKMQKAGRGWRKRQATEDYLVAGLISKRTFLPGLSWAAARWLSLHTHTCQILKVYIEDLTGFSHTAIQVVSILHSILKVYLWRTSENRGGKWPRAEEGVGSLQLPGSSSQVNQYSYLLKCLLQYSSNLAWLHLSSLSSHDQVPPSDFPLSATGIQDLHKCTN